MATGRRASLGNQASLIAAILTAHPAAVSAMRAEPELPAALDHVVERCLAKEPDDRWQTARDVRMELEWVAGGNARRPIVAAPARRRVSEYVAWTAAALASVQEAGWWSAASRRLSRSIFIVTLPAG